MDTELITRAYNAGCRFIRVYGKLADTIPNRNPKQPYAYDGISDLDRHMRPTPKQVTAHLEAGGGLAGVPGSIGYGVLDVDDYYDDNGNFVKGKGVKNELADELVAAFGTAFKPRYADPTDKGWHLYYPYERPQSNADWVCMRLRGEVRVSNGYCYWRNWERTLTALLNKPDDPYEGGVVGFGSVLTHKEMQLSRQRASHVSVENWGPNEAVPTYTNEQVMTRLAGKTINDKYNYKQFYNNDKASIPPHLKSSNGKVDYSRAHYNLIKALCYECATSDPYVICEQQAIDLFIASPLYTEGSSDRFGQLKPKRGIDYVFRSFANAIIDLQADNKTCRQANQSSVDDTYGDMGMFDINDATALDWEIYPWYLKHQVNLLCATQSTGKSSHIAYLAALKSIGGTWVDGTQQIDVGPVFIFSPEDHAVAVIYRRLMEHGANPNNFRIYGSKPGPSDGPKVVEDPDVSWELDDIFEYVKARLDAVDGGYKGNAIMFYDVTGSGLDSEKSGNDNNDVRAYVQKLQSFATKHKVTIILTAHTKKEPIHIVSRGSKLVDLLIGSQAWTAAVRCVVGLYLVTIKGKTSVLAVGIKGNYGATGVFEYQHMSTAPDSEGHCIGRVNGDSIVHKDDKGETYVVQKLLTAKREYLNEINKDEDALFKDISEARLMDSVIYSALYNYFYRDNVTPVKPFMTFMDLQQAIKMQANVKPKHHDEKALRDWLYDKHAKKLLHYVTGPELNILVNWDLKGTGSKKFICKVDEANAKARANSYTFDNTQKGKQ